MLISKAMSAFITAAQEKSLKKTAEKLCLTIPPVSRMLKNTEKWYGEKLFTIERNNITLTATGERIYHQLMPVYSALRNLKRNKRKQQLTLSSPIMHFTPLIAIIEDIIKEISSPPIIRHANDMRDDDDIFISFHRVLRPSCYFEELTFNLPLDLNCHHSAINRWRTMDLLGCQGIINTPEFQRTLNELRAQGFTGNVLQLDNTGLCLNLLETGQALLFKNSNPYSAREYCILPCHYEQPVHLYKNTCQSQPDADFFVSHLSRIIAAHPRA